MFLVPTMISLLKPNPLGFLVLPQVYVLVILQLGCAYTPISKKDIRGYATIKEINNMAYALQGRLTKE